MLASGHPERPIALLPMRRSVSPAAFRPFVEVAGLGEARQRVAESRALEDASDLVIEVDRAGERIRRGLLLEHAHAPALLPEEDGQDLTHRAVADDDDVVSGFRQVRSHGSRGSRTSASCIAQRRSMSNGVAPSGSGGRIVSCSSGSPAR
jgi:hypothetical protein